MFFAVSRIRIFKARHPHRFFEIGIGLSISESQGHPIRFHRVMWIMSENVRDNYLLKSELYGYLHYC